MNPNCPLPSLNFQFSSVFNYHRRRRRQDPGASVQRKFLKLIPHLTAFASTWRPSGLLRHQTSTLCRPVASCSAMPRRTATKPGPSQPQRRFAPPVPYHAMSWHPYDAAAYNPQLQYGAGSAYPPVAAASSGAAPTYPYPPNAAAAVPAGHVRPTPHAVMATATPHMNQVRSAGPGRYSAEVIDVDALPPSQLASKPAPTRDYIGHSSVCPTADEWNAVDGLLMISAPFIKNEHGLNVQDKPFVCGVPGCKFRFAWKNEVGQHFSDHHGAGAFVGRSIS